MPVEVVKQRAQAFSTNSIQVLEETYFKFGVSGLYRGYVSTLFREIPFSFIQFPLWEYLKQSWSKYQNSPVLPYQAMLCGSLAGGISAFLTTPLDVAKTQIILRDFRNSSNAQILSKSMKVDYFYTINSIYSQRGISG